MRELLVVMGLASAACVADQPQPPDETAPPDDTPVERLAANGLSSATLQANLSSVNQLASAALVASNAGVKALVATSGGQTVLTYLVQCALPASASVTSGSLTFTGQLGLAPEWATTTPTASNRRWVTACVLARTNYFGVTVSLSLRGSNPALAASLTEPITYAITEAAFWGDLFAPGGPTQYTCDALIKETGLSLSTTSLRDCSIPAAGSTTTSMCGFSFIGHCGVLDLSLAPACKAILAPYGNCHTSQSASSPTIAEVITVDLATL